MMPVSDTDEADEMREMEGEEEGFFFQGFPEHQIDYKQKYKGLKKKLKILVYEQECFLEEMRKSQRALLKVSRDRSFLLDRLLAYENIEDSSGDSDATASSDSDAEAHKDGTPAKRRKMAGGSHAQLPGLHGDLSHLVAGAGLSGLAQPSSASQPEGGKKRARPSGGKKTGKGGKVAVSKKGGGADSSSSKQQQAQQAQQQSTAQLHQQLQQQLSQPVELASHPVLAAAASQPPGQMTREELERHLESRQNNFGIEKAPALLPMEIFSNDNSNPDSNDMGMEGDEDTDLVIDMPR